MILMNRLIGLQSCKDECFFEPLHCPGVGSRVQGVFPHKQAILSLQFFNGNSKIRWLSLIINTADRRHSKQMIIAYQLILIVPLAELQIEVPRRTTWLINWQHIHVWPTIGIGCSIKQASQHQAPPDDSVPLTALLHGRMTSRPTNMTE